MDTQKFLDFCISEVVRYFNQKVDTTDRKALTKEDVYVVWSCKTLGNNKALAVGVIGASAMISDVNWITVVSAAGLAGVVSLLTSVAGLPECKEE